MVYIMLVVKALLRSFFLCAFKKGVMAFELSY